MLIMSKYANNIHRQKSGIVMKDKDDYLDD